MLTSQLMRCKEYRLRLAVIVLPFLFPFTAFSMDLPHLRLDSLVYLSTDIVIATVSQEPQGRFMATVTETLYGSLLPGEKLKTLSEFLGFFRPMNPGQQVILFLDRHPRQGDFFHPEASKSLFSVPPSGVYLIDAYYHVHEYYQESNPGSYVAQGYRFFLGPVVPTQAEDLALPSLDDVKTRISASVKSIQAIRPLLDKTASRADAPALMNLLVARPRNRESCRVEMNDVIAGRLVAQIRSLNDPELLLRTGSLESEFDWDAAFVRPYAKNYNKQFSDARVQYLIATLSNRKKPVPLRISAVETLIGLSQFHPTSGPPRVLPIDSLWLAPFATAISATMKEIFDNRAEDGHLRSLCLQFLDLNKPEIVVDVRRVYVQAPSEELRFAIEEKFLKSSQELYKSLNPPGGPVASIIRLATENGCVRPPDDRVAFVARYLQTQEFHDQWGGFVSQHFVLISNRTGQSFALKDVEFLSGWEGVLDGETVFQITRIPNLPEGEYDLGPEYNEGDKILSVGHRTTVVISTEHGKKQISAKRSRRKLRRMVINFEKSLS